MFKDFLTALTIEITNFLAKHDDFFTGKAEARSKQLKNVTLPAPFKHYLEQVSEKDFMQDLKLLVDYVASPKKTNISGSAFFKAVSEFFVDAFASKLDKLSGDYYLFSDKDRQKVVDQLIKSDSRTAQTLKNMLMYKTYQQMAAAIQDLSSAATDAPFIVVQSPREMDAELKKDVRHKLQKEDALAFPVFQINRKLIGGLRVFRNGKTQDHSWLNRVMSIQNLTV